MIGLMSDIEQRKEDHIKLSLDTSSQGQENPFEKYRLPYTALPEIDLESVSTETVLFGKKLSQPLIISSMTGGTAHAATINTNLAIAAEASNVALGVGSQRIAIEKEEVIKTFKLARDNAPNAVIFANIGAIQLNNGLGIKDFKKAIDMIEADGLYLHVNPLQEALQPGGDTNYSGLMNKIGNLVSSIGVPVFVKEVGHGIDEETAKKLFDLGVAGIDVAGVGGTSYGWIEAKRADNNDYASWFKDVGVPTDLAIIGAAKHKKNRLVVASGGLRDPVSAVKARALGADFYAMATPLLEYAIKDPDETTMYVENFRRGVQIAMFTCGVDSWEKASKLNLQ